DVVDAHHQGYRGDVRLVQDIAVETRERVHAHAVLQDLGTGDALVQHRDRRAASLHQARGEIVRPAVEAIDRGAVAVGDGIAEGDDGTGIRRRIDHQTAQEDARDDAAV